MEIFNTWQFYFVVYMVLMSINFQVFKLAVKNAVRDGAAVIVIQVIAGFSALMLFPFFEIKFSTDLKVYFFLALSIIFYTFNDRLQGTCRKYLDVSLFTILIQLTNLFLFIYGVIFYNEIPTVKKIIGAGLIILGNILLLYKKGTFKINRYVIMNIVAAFFLATALAIDIGNSENFNLPIYIMILFIAPALLIKVVERVKVKDLLNELQLNNKRFFIITGIAWGLASVFWFRAMQLGEITTIAPLDGSIILINVLLAYLIHKEKDDRIKRFIAAIIIVSGVVFLV